MSARLRTTGLLLLLAVGAAGATRCHGTATYDVTVANSLGTTRFAGGPESLVFSPLTVAAHEEGGQVLSVGQQASSGVEEVAETGNNQPLLRSLEEAGASAASSNGPVRPGQTATVRVTADCRNRRLSFVSMIAPSPDWIVFVSDLDLVTPSGDFSYFRTGRLVAYDAGTDSGRAFTDPSDRSLDIPTTPQGTIGPLARDPTDPGFGSRTVGRYTVARVEVPEPPAMPTPPTTPTVPTPPAPQPRCRGKATYAVTILNGLGKVAIKGAPERLVFSPLTAAAHGMKGQVLSVGQQASSGVEEVAETGNNQPLMEMLEDMDGVGSVAGASGPTLPGTKTTVKVEVDCTHPYVSAVAMIAPSPDWIVLAQDLRVMSPNGRFTPKLVRRLVAYDAGTDSGRAFTDPSDQSLDEPTTPQGTIRPLARDPTDPGFGFRTVGYLAVHRVA